MDIATPLPLLGGLSAADFMRRHWQKKPLLVRGAPDALPGFDRRRLFALAAKDDVESRWSCADRRLVQCGRAVRRAPAAAAHGPAGRCWSRRRRLRDAAAHRLLGRFRFVPDARLDDVMVSYASPAAASVRTSIPTTSSCFRSKAGGAGASGPRGAAVRAMTCR